MLDAYDWFRARSKLTEVSGIVLPLEQEYLGDGSEGTVYGIDEKRAVKFTNSVRDARTSAWLMNHPIPNVVKILGVYHKPRKGYAIVLERLSTGDSYALLNNIFDVYAEAHAGLQLNCARNYSSTIGYKNPKLVKEICRITARADVKKVVLALHNLYNAGIKWNDFHDENLLWRKIGPRKKEPVIIDMGFSRGVSGEVVCLS